MKSPFIPSNPTDSEHEAAHQWIKVWSILVYLMLAAATLAALFDQGLSANNHLIALGFGLVYGGWYAGAKTLMSRRGRKSRLLGLSFAVIISIIVLMVEVNPVYYMLLYSLYGLAFAMLNTPMAIGITALVSAAGAVTTIQINDTSWPGSGWIILAFLLSFGFSTLFGLYITAIINQSIERQQLIVKLRAAQESQARAEREAGILEERQRLAREIHDTLAQGFTSVVMHLEAADESLTAVPEDARRHIDQARATARESLSEARRFVWALRSGPLEHNSLSEAIQRAAVRWSEETAVPARVEVAGEARQLPAAYDVALLRTAQESLVNVRKHSQASQVTLTLTYLEDQVSLDVQDNGVGFDPALVTGVKPDGDGYGLLGLRERVEALGGSLNVESAPGEGTTLVVALPFQSPPPPEKEGA